MVLSNNFDYGWKAYVNDVPTPLFPAYLAFTGMVVPRGTSRIRLVYRPTSFLVGSAISALGLAGLALCLIMSYRAP